MADALPFAAYVRAAFNFRPFGMFVAPNWIALGVAGLLGLLNPGFWLLGLAGEGIYLLTLVRNARFRALVDAFHNAKADAPAEARETERLTLLREAEQKRYARLRAQAEAIVAGADPSEPDAAREDRARLLERMLGVFLDLLVGGAHLSRALASQDPDVPRRLEEARRQLAAAPEGDLRESLADQVGVLAARAEAWQATRERRAWIAAELARIEEHVGLLRDRALLRGDPTSLGAEVDRLTEMLVDADRWLREQQALDVAAPADAPRLRPREGATR